VVLSIVLRAAARSISIPAACRDLAKAPSDHAVMTVLEDGLPKTLPVLERRLNEALTGPLPRAMRRRAWEIVIDWHLQPYYGRANKSRNELYYGQRKQGTSKFHAYATACIVEHGRRYRHGVERGVNLAKATIQSSHSQILSVSRDVSEYHPFLTAFSQFRQRVAASNLERWCGIGEGARRINLPAKPRFSG
jgi:hypothetical protein